MDFNISIVCDFGLDFIVIFSKFNYFIGVTPQRNKFYTPSADGCGSLGMKISKEYLPAVEMENCCNDHDICYDTCNKDKELCDIEFKRCLYNYCDSHEKSAVGTIVTKGCKTAAKMLFTGTITLGCKSYLDAQERSCYCGSSSSSSSSKSDRNGYDKKESKKSKKYSKDANYQKEPPPAGWNV